MNPPIFCTRFRLLSIFATMGLLLAASVAQSQTAVVLSAQQSTLGSGFFDPFGVAVDTRGDVFVADTGNNAVKEMVAVGGSVPASPTILTLGSGFSTPSGVAVDASGDVFVADTGNNAVKEMVAASGSVPASPTILTLGSGFFHPSGVALDASGDVFVADAGNNAVKEMVAVNGSVPPSPTIRTLGSGFLDPFGVAVDAIGDVFVADAGNNAVKEMVAVGGSVSASSTILTLGSGFLDPFGVAVDASGNVFVADAGNNAVKEIVAVDGSVPASPTILTLGSGFFHPSGVALGNGAFVADSGNNRVVRVPQMANFSPTAIGTTSAAQTVTAQIATSGTTIDSVSIPVSQGGKQEFTVGADTCSQNTSLSAGATCNIQVTFSPAYPGLRSAPLLVVTYNGTDSFGLSGIGNGPQAALTPGTIATSAGNGTPGFSGDGGAATSAELARPYADAMDAAGNLYISDYNNSRVRKVSPTGIITTVAGNGTAGYTGDGGPATSAEIDGPLGLAVDAAGNLYIADSVNSVIRRVGPSGIITTVAGNGTQGFSGDGGAATSAELHYPYGVLADSAGDLYISDTYNFRVREVNASGAIATVAGNGTQGNAGDGGQATAAELGGPIGLAQDSAGNLYIADYVSNVVRKVTPAGIISTVAGTGTAGYNGDGGAATGKQLNQPAGLATDSAGDLYIADISNNRVRGVGVSGIITTIAGNGTQGFTGDGGPATSAELYLPSGIALDSAGNLYIADQENNRIREVDVQSASLAFATTVVGATSSDSPQTRTLWNIGNGALTFAVPSTGNNPNVSSNFSLSNTGTCPQLGTSSSSATLNSGSSCTLALNFAPVTASGALTGTAVVTDNALNAAAATQTVNLSGTATPVGTTTTLQDTTPTYGQTQITATVAPASGAAVPIGSVVFTVDGVAEPAVTLNSSGVAMLPAAVSTTLTAGSHTVRAVFTGNAGSGSAFNSSTATALVFVIAQASALVTLDVNPAAPVYGSPVTVTVTATAGSVGISGSTATVTAGGNHYPCTTNASGTCSVTVPSLPAGTDTLTATTSATSNAAAGSGSTSVLVGKAALTVTATNATRIYGAANPAFTGVVTGAVNGDTFAIAGTTTATVASPVGTYPIAPVATGAHLADYTVTAVDGTLTVTQAALTVTATNATRIYGAANPAFTGVVTGAVNGDTFAIAGTTTATVASPVGTYPIAPVATGAHLADYTVTAVDGTLTVTQATATQVAVNVSPLSPAYGQSATANVTVTAGAAPVAGSTISVAVNGHVYLCTTGASGACSATIPGSAWNAGANTVTVTSSATANATSGTDTVVIQVAAPITAPDFSLNLLTSSSQFVSPGEVAAIPLSLAGMNGFSGPVVLSVSGLPPGAMVGFHPGTVTLSGTTAVGSLMSIVTAPAQARLARGEGGPPRGGSAIRYGLLLLPLPLLGIGRLRKRMRALPRVLLLLLALTGLGAVTSGLTGCGAGYFGQPPANYSITVTGTSGSLQSSTTFTLTVR